METSAICIQCQGIGYIVRNSTKCPLCKGTQFIKKGDIAKILGTATPASKKKN